MEEALNGFFHEAVMNFCSWYSTCPFTADNRSHFLLWPRIQNAPSLHTYRGSNERLVSALRRHCNSAICLICSYLYPMVYRWLARFPAVSSFAHSHSTLLPYAKPLIFLGGLSVFHKDPFSTQSILHFTASRQILEDFRIDPTFGSKEIF